MYYDEHLIIAYIHEPAANRYVFQLAGGAEVETTSEEFTAHWQLYRAHEKERAAEALDHYHPLPVTLEIRLNLKLSPSTVNTRRCRRRI